MIPAPFRRWLRNGGPFLCALCAMALCPWPSSSRPLKPEAERTATEIADDVTSVMRPIMVNPSNAIGSNRPEITVSLTFPQRGRRPVDSRCLPALHEGFEKQVKLLAAAVPMDIRAASSKSPGTMAFVVGDVFGKTADLSDVPLGTWHAEAKSRARAPLKEWTRDLGIPGQGPSNVHSGLYRESDGELSFGHALIGWNSLLLRVELDAPDANCWLNFVNQIVALYVLGIEERLHDELDRVYFTASQRATGGISDFHQQSLIGIDVGFLINADVFCRKVLGAATPVKGVAACGLRVATLMIAKDI